MTWSALKQADECEGGYTLLVVEDDPTHQLLIKRELTKDESLFAVVQFARNSDDAEHFARQMRFDCMLVDNRIPGRRGLDLVAYLRKEGVKAPLILMTSEGNEDLAVQAYRHSCAEYVIKDTGFWKGLPALLERVIREDRARQREAEFVADLEGANKKLESLNSEVRLRNEELRKINASLNKARKDLEDFTYVISESLARPVAEIQAAISAFRDSKSKVPKKMGAHIDNLDGATEAIIELAGRLKNMSSFSGLNKHPEKLDFSEFLNELHRGMKELQ